MRLFLIPISTKRTLVYAQRLNKITTQKPTYADKISARAAKMWLNWESHDKGWQKQCTVYGNKLFNRIPFEEWGLKSIPPLSAMAKPDPASPAPPKKIDVIFPPSILPQSKIPELLKHLGTSRTALHRHHLIWSIVGMPIVAPFALVPIIPNIPFFYLVYRAFSHWRALEGGKHLRYLVEKDLVNPVPSKEMDEVFVRRKVPTSRIDEGLLAEKGVEEWKEVTNAPVENKAAQKEEEALLLVREDSKRIAEVVGVPGLAVECERASSQVEEQLRQRAYGLAQGIRLRKAGVPAKEG